MKQFGKNEVQRRKEHIKLSTSNTQHNKNDKKMKMVKFFLRFIHWVVKHITRNSQGD